MSSEWTSIMEARFLLQKKFSVTASLDFLAQIQSDFLQSV